MHITICGGGNAAHTLVALLGHREDIHVRVFAPYGNEAEQWRLGTAHHGGILAHTPQGPVLGRPVRISPYPDDVIPGADIVILALPAFVHRVTLEAIIPYIRPQAWLGALPARNGFLWEVQDVFKHLGRKPDITVFGLQTLPWACRVRVFGQEVDVLGTKEIVDIAVWPSTHREGIVSTLSHLLGVPLVLVENFLALGLADVGQIIHPGIMYGLFHQWDGTPFIDPPLFYQGMDEPTAHLLDAMSNEILAIRGELEQRYPQRDWRAIRHIGEWIRRTYGRSIQDDSSLHRCFVTNTSYRGLTAPMKPVDGGFVPDFRARYLTEDVPYGLVVTRGIAEILGVPTPTIDKVILWAQGKMHKEYLRDGKLNGKDLQSTRAPQRYGEGALEMVVER